MLMTKQALFLLIAFTLAACHPQEPAQNAAQSTAARVGEQTITEADLAARRALLSKEDREFSNTPIGRQNLLQIITREKLIQIAAQEEGLDKTPEYLSLLQDKRQQLDEIYQDFARYNLEQYWYDKQQTSGLTAVSDKEIDEYYKKYPYEMTVKQIILDNAQTADQVLRTLKGSPGRWKEMERQYSVAPESLRQLSFMPGEYLADIEVIAANSPTGSVQGFFKTPQGFHIIMKTSEKRLPRQEAEPRIREVLENKKTDEALEALKNKYEVVIYEKSE